MMARSMRVIHIQWRRDNETNDRNDMKNIFYIQELYTVWIVWLARDRAKRKREGVKRQIMENKRP